MSLFFILQFAFLNFHFAIFYSGLGDLADGVDPACRNS